MKARASATASSAMSSAAACCCIWSTPPASTPARPTRRCASELDAYGGQLADKIEIVALNKIDAVDAGRLEEAEGPAEARREEDAAAALGHHRRGRQGSVARARRCDRRSPGLGQGEGRRRSLTRRRPSVANSCAAASAIPETREPTCRGHFRIQPQHACLLNVAPFD